jgi:4'-phosphopantetheinyl transferase
MKYSIKNIYDFPIDVLYNFYNKIPEIKRNKIDKLKNINTKKCSIIGELLLNDLINDEVYNKVDYYFNEYGKPYFKNTDLFFNISHSFDYVITAISEKEIGIDIEKIRKTPINVINQFATGNEKKYILSSSSNIEERIFKIYTLKEAYVKMLGTNMNDVFQIEFEIINNNVSCSDNNVKVGFIDDIEGYIIAYCERKYSIK